MLLIRLLMAAAGIAHGQPGIAQNGVVNAASRIPTTLAGGPIARGARFSVQGVRFGSLPDTRISLSQGGTEVPVRVLSVQAERIDALMPLTVPLGTVALRVTAGGQTSLPISIQVVRSNPGIFSRNGEGWGPGRIRIRGPHGDIENSLQTPARRGASVALEVTGLGDSREISLVIGNRVTRGERKPVPQSAPGMNELVATIPADSPQGCYVPVYLKSGPNRASNVVTMSIHDGKGPCGPEFLPAADRMSVLALSRDVVQGREASGESISDEFVGVFARKAEKTVQSPLLMLPPAGTCTAYTSSFQASTVLPASLSAALIAELSGRGLDAGPALSLERPDGVRSVPRQENNPGLYRATLGRTGGRGSRRARPLFFNDESITLRGAGGSETGAFSVRVPAPEPIDWTNRQDLGSIDRSQGVRLAWRAGSRAGLVVILATNVDQKTTAIGTCLCTARPSDANFSIPAELLANLPPSRNMPGAPYDRLFLAWIQPPVDVQASGLDRGSALSMYAVGRIVEYR